MKLITLLFFGALLAAIEFPRLYRQKHYAELLVATALLLLALPLAGKLIWAWPIPSPIALYNLLGAPVNYLLQSWLGPVSNP